MREADKRGEERERRKKRRETHNAFLASYLGVRERKSEKRCSTKKGTEGILSWG